MSHSEKYQQQSGVSEDTTEEVHASSSSTMTSSDRRSRILASFDDLPLLPAQVISEEISENDEDSPTDYGYSILPSDDYSRGSSRHIVRRQTRSFRSPMLSDIEEEEPVLLRSSLMPISTRNRFPIDGSYSSISPEDDNIQYNRSAGRAESKMPETTYSPKSARHDEPLRNLQDELEDIGAENGSASPVSDGSYKQFMSTLDECHQPQDEDQDEEQLSDHKPLHEEQLSDHKPLHEEQLSDHKPLHEEQLSDRINIQVEQLSDHKLIDTRYHRREDSRNGLELRRFGTHSQTPANESFKEAHDNDSENERIERGRKRFRDPLPGEYKPPSRKVQNHAASRKPNADKLLSRPPLKPPIFYKNKASMVKIKDTKDTKVLKWLLSSTETMIKLSRDIESLMFQAWYYADSQEWYLALTKIEKARNLRAELVAFNHVYQRHVNSPHVSEWMVQQSHQPMSRVPAELTRTMPGFVYNYRKGHQTTISQNEKPIESQSSNSNDVTCFSSQPITQAEGGDIGLCRLTRQQSRQHSHSVSGASSEEVRLRKNDRNTLKKGDVEASSKEPSVASLHDDFVSSGQSGYLAPDVDEYDQMRELLEARIQETSKKPERPRQARVIDSLKGSSKASLHDDFVASGRNGCLAAEIGEFNRVRALLNARTVQDRGRYPDQTRRRLRVVNCSVTPDLSQTSSASSKQVSNKKEASKNLELVDPSANITQPFSFEGRATSREVFRPHHQNEPAAFVEEPVVKEFRNDYKHLTSLHVDKETAAKIWESNWDRVWVWPEAEKPGDWPKLENPALMDDPVITPALLWESLKRSEDDKTARAKDDAVYNAWGAKHRKYADPGFLARHDEVERDKKRRVAIQPFVEALRRENGMELISKWARGVVEVVDGTEIRIDDRLWFHVGATSGSETSSEDRDLETDRLLALGAALYPMEPPRSDLPSSSGNRNPLLTAWDEPDTRTVEEKRKETYQILIGEITEKVAGGCYDNLIFLGDPTYLNPTLTNPRGCYWFGTNVLWREEWFAESNTE